MRIYNISNLLKDAELAVCYLHIINNERNGINKGLIKLDSIKENPEYNLKLSEFIKLLRHFDINISSSIHEDKLLTFNEQVNLLKVLTKEFSLTNNSKAL